MGLVHLYQWENRKVTVTTPMKGVKTGRMIRRPDGLFAVDGMIICAGDKVEYRGEVIRAYM